MNDLCEYMPIACSLTSAEFRAHEAKLLARFRSAAIETEELQNGYSFRLSGDSDGIGLVAELIVAERECCPFLKFELAALPRRGPVMVRITGPDGAKEFLKTIFCKSDAATQALPHRVVE